MLRHSILTVLIWVSPFCFENSKHVVVHLLFSDITRLSCPCYSDGRSCADRKSMGYVELTLLQTLHHASQQKVEGYILELIVGLHHLVSRARNNHGQRSPQKSPIRSPVLKASVQKFVPPERNISPPPFAMFSSANRQFSSNGQYIPHHEQVRPVSLELSQEDKEMLHDIECGLSQRKVIPGLSKSQEFDTSRVAANRELLRLSKSNSHSPSSTNKGDVYQPVCKPRKHTVNLHSPDIDRLHEHAFDGAGPHYSSPLVHS